MTDNIQTSTSSDRFADWKSREHLAESMIPLVGKLYRERNVKTYVYGHALPGAAVAKIMQAHQFMSEVERLPITEKETWPLLQSLQQLDLGPARVDIGRLAIKFYRLRQGEQKKSSPSLQAFLTTELQPIAGKVKKPLLKPRDVILYGFGRIGRMMARLLVDEVGSGEVLRLRAVVSRTRGENDLHKRAELLRTDSVHGPFSGTVLEDFENSSLVVNGNVIKMLTAEVPSQLDYTAGNMENAIVIDNTGAWRTEEGLAQHLQVPGATKVLLTAPGKGSIKNIVYGVNDDLLSQEDSIVAAASCTTNAVVPPLKVINDEYGIEHVHMETVHAYTNDQNLIDNYHKSMRRGRSAALNMVLTTTGASNAATQVLPELSGRVTGNALRVPVANCSMAILNVTLSRATTRDEINEFMRYVALHSPLHRQIGYTTLKEAVSTDFIGTRQACVFDPMATIVSGNHCVLYFWYDNEFGYACQVHRVLGAMAGVKYAAFPAL